MAATTLGDINATLQEQNATLKDQTQTTKSLNSNISFLVKQIQSERLDNREKEIESQAKSEQDKAKGQSRATGAKASGGLGMLGMLGGLGGLFSGIIGMIGGAVGGISSLLGLKMLTPLITSLWSFARLFLRGGAIGFVLYLIYDNWESIQGVFTNIYKALEPIIKWFKETTVYKYLEENWEQIVTDFFGLFKKLFKGLERITAGDFKGALENMDGLAFGLAGLLAFTKTGRGLVASAVTSVKDLVTGGINAVTDRAKGRGKKLPGIAGKVEGVLGGTLGTMTNPMYVKVVGGGPLMGGGPGGPDIDGPDKDKKSDKKPGKPGKGGWWSRAKDIGKSFFGRTGAAIAGAGKAIGSYAVGAGKAIGTATGGATLGLAATAAAMGYATYKGKVQIEEWAKLKAQVDKNGLSSLSTEDLKKFIAAQEDFAEAEDQPEGMIRTPDGRPVDRFLTEQATRSLKVKSAPITKPRPQVAPTIQALNTESRQSANKQIVVIQDGSNRVVNNVSNSTQGLVLPAPRVFDVGDPFFSGRGAGY